MLDPQEPTMTDHPRIVIYEDDEILFDSADPATYTILDDPRELLSPLPDPDVADCEQPPQDHA